MDLSIALYNNNLFSVDSDLLPNSQYIFLSCNSSCLRLVYIYIFSNLACDPGIALNIWHLLPEEFSDHSMLLIDAFLLG